MTYSTDRLLADAQRLMYCAGFAILLVSCAAAPEPVAPQVQKPAVTPPPVVPPTPAPPPAAQTAAELSLSLLGAPEAIPGWNTDAAAPDVALALRRSCPALVKRTDGSGLTQPADWKPLCDAVLAGEDAKLALARHTRAVAVTDGLGLNTGYFEPLLEGSFTPSARFATPLYKRPPDLIDVSLGDFRDALKGQRTAGKLHGTKLIPYASRAEIEEGALANKGLELIWMADPYETFSLHIQGSGQIRLPDGSTVRVGYDGQNGHPYVGVGKLLRERGILGPGQATMDGILNWARANPDAGKSLFRENPSYVFFRRVDDDGPIGSLNIALVPERSIAVDPLFVPLGAPVWLNTRHVDPLGSRTPEGQMITVPFARIMVAQDTGGAIKGINRLDIFFGSNIRARALASAQSYKGSLTLLLPIASVDRLQSSGKIMAAQPAPSP